ncbi:unnamed protein product [Caenorhabditis bovis]|uniref:C2 domain-containing protein n=1 Tax=Caenorhabditis bovis TaxID=2654633 RepID=A0A8S1F098_9PELO|nr:unnamed protein product [Caenorhabditis bovis]
MHRRNSVSVEDGVVGKPAEIGESKKSRPDRLFLRSTSVGQVPIDGEQSPNARTERRRESIKDHLLKFKAKAEKILEDVQIGAKNDENVSGSFISQTSDAETREDVSLNDEQATSESSFQQGKKESKEQLRNRIRKSAKKAVERTKGSVQLTKRLARRPTIVLEESINENDIRSIDEQVEKTIKKEVDEFLIGNHHHQQQSAKRDREPRNVLYGRLDTQKFDHDILVSYTTPDRNIVCGELINRNMIEAVKTAPTRIDFAEPIGAIFSGPEGSEGVYSRLRRKNYVQLDVFVDSLHIDQHELFDNEEMLACELRNLYFAQMLKVHALAQIESHQIDDDEKSAMLNEIRAGRERLASIWDQLKTTRQSQRFIATEAVYHPPEANFDDDWTRIGKIDESAQITPLNKVPKTHRERISKIKKTSIQLILFFNEMEVSRTAWLPLKTFLIAVLRRFELELYSPAQSLTFKVFEKCGAVVKSVGVARVPLPNDNDDEIALHEAEFDNGRILCRAILESGQLRFADDCHRIDDAYPTGHETDARFELIPDDIFFGEPIDASADKRRLDELRDERKSQIKYVYRSAIDSKRRAAINYANLARKRVADRRIQADKKYEDLVRELPIPSLSVAFSQFFSPVDESRRLKPMRRGGGGGGGTLADGWNRAIMINVQSAVCLPTRETGQLQPFVVVRYGSQSLKSTVALGRHPNWQFTGKLTLNENDREQEFIELSVYDQIVEQLDKDDRIHNVVYEQLTSRLLGIAQIRFSALASAAKLNGPIKWHMATHISNYKIPIEPAFLKILISTQIADGDECNDVKEVAQTNEPARIMSACHELKQHMLTINPNRTSRPFVVDLNGRSVLCCRFLRAVVPPTILMQENHDNLFRICQLAGQIVSAMPKTRATSQSDIWATLDQIINLAVCSLEERATLLACWLLHFKLQPTILLGVARGEKTGFVLIDIHGKHYLIDPEDGHLYSESDANCPLASITGAFDAKNYYANVQEYESISQISLSFSRSSHWRPLLAAAAADELHLDSVQPAIVHYAQVTEDWVLELRIALEREIKLAFDEARSHAIPHWNLAASRQLREALEVTSSPDSIGNVIDDKLSRIKESYIVNVVVFKIPYVSIQNTIESVMHTNLHEALDERTQFALAVQIEPYFAHVIHVEFAIAALKPKL